MKIGLCGTMSVGKTTLINYLHQDFHFAHFHKATERSKYLNDLGIPLNTDSTLKGQLVFLAERSSELLRSRVLTDRTIWDVCAFTNLAKSMSDKEKNDYEQTAMNLKDEYDLVVYVKPDGVRIEDNGVRETNSNYRDNIDDEIRRLLELYPPKNLLVISGSTEERASAILSHIYQ